MSERLTRSTRPTTLTGTMHAWLAVATAFSGYYFSHRLPASPVS